jgi:hypothetical protein
MNECDSYLIDEGFWVRYEMYAIYGMDSNIETVLNATGIG